MKEKGKAFLPNFFRSLTWSRVTSCGWPSSGGGYTCIRSWGGREGEGRERGGRGEGGRVRVERGREGGRGKEGGREGGREGERGKVRGGGR